MVLRGLFNIFSLVYSSRTSITCPEGYELQISPGYFEETRLRGIFCEQAGSVLAAAGGVSCVRDSA